MTTEVSSTDPAGLLVVDKPPGLTSHDVVARIRRLAHTRRVGHAGTLDPMATGVLVVGVGAATRLLGHLSLTDKSYDATIRLGVTTDTDDAEGSPLQRADPAALAAVPDAAVAAGLRALTGTLEQTPPAVSAIKVDGVRSYTRARAGETVTLAPRPVTVTRLDLLARRGPDLDVTVECSTGTYIRSLARDLGATLGVGAHLGALRRTRVGDFDVAEAVPLDRLESARDLTPLAQAAARSFVTVTVSQDEAIRIRHGQRRVLEAVRAGAAPIAILDPAGELAALCELRDGVAHPLAVFG